jgi:hypothetical protein
MTTDLRTNAIDGEGTLRLPGVESAPPPQRVSAEDMELLRAFQADLAAAQRAYNTLMMQFSGRYQLREGDRIDLDGSITRQS